MFFLLPLAFFLISLPLVITYPTFPQMWGEAISHVKTHEKVVALTFDDGPLPKFTDAILQVLKKHDVHATFFVVGKRVQENPDLVKATIADGHEVGNHSWNHPVFLGKSKKFVKEQIQKTDAILRDLGYDKEIYFRSPYGQKLITLPRVLARMKKKNILFDVWAWDWSSPGTKKIVRNVVHAAGPGSIILLHDGCGTSQQTVAATDAIITKLKEKGYRFVTVSELLALRGNSKNKGNNERNDEEHGLSSLRAQNASVS